MAFLSLLLSGMSVLMIFATVSWQISSIAVAYYIFKDAQKRGMKAGRWLWLSVLCLLGLAIYIVARRDIANEKCPSCGTEVKAGWDFCPVCSADLTGLQKEAVAQQNKAPLKGAIALYVILPLTVCVCLVCTVLFSSSPIGEFKKQVYTIEELAVEYPTAYEWVKECDKDKEHDVFVDYSEYRDVAVIYTKGWIAEGAELKLSGKSNFFGATEVNIKLPQGEFIVSDGYNITVVRGVEKNFDCIEAYSGDEQVEVKLTEEGIIFW